VNRQFHTTQNVCELTSVVNQLERKTINETMMMFHSAVLIVAPHGAGLSNMLFSQPGTYVIEGLCNPPYIVLCYQRLAYVLGHHWHGVMARRGCQKFVDISSYLIESITRKFLHLWKSGQQQQLSSGES